MRLYTKKLQLLLKKAKILTKTRKSFFWPSSFPGEGALVGERYLAPKSYVKSFTCVTFDVTRSEIMQSFVSCKRRMLLRSLYSACNFHKVNRARLLKNSNQFWAESVYL